MRDLARVRRRGASRLANGWRAGVDIVTAAITIELMIDDTSTQEVKVRVGVAEEFVLEIKGGDWL